MKLLKAGALYFCGVFAAGFALGVVRLLFLVPLLGVRLAELVEMPVMLVVIVFCARGVVRRYCLTAAWIRLGVGFLALVLLLAAEYSLLVVQGKALAAYLAGRDPVSGAVYAAMLLLFALMPLLAKR